MHDYTSRYNELKYQIDARLESVIDKDQPASLYLPARYILSAGGKRIRAILVLLACEAVGGRADDAYDAGLAVEILHAFTLVHDDIMDNASHRRGRATVHTKWDHNTAILVGDALVGIAYRMLLRTQRGDVRAIADVFTDGTIEVCEGQSYDKKFEALDAVSRRDYDMMIEKKTGKLVTMSAELGALIGSATEAQRAALVRYGAHIGRAFQIQDDLLDVIADEEEFGKPIGGDILEGKKTFLLVEALQRATGPARTLLEDVAAHRRVPPTVVDEVRDIYTQIGVTELARTQIREVTDAAIGELHALPESDARAMLVWFAEMLLRRSF